LSDPESRTTVLVRASIKLPDLTDQDHRTETEGSDGQQPITALFIVVRESPIPLSSKRKPHS
jgi:hypothetical protein